MTEKEKTMKIKDKKTVCLVVLGVSLVSLISAIISGFVVGIMDLIDELQSIIAYGESGYILLSVAYLLQVALSAAFAAIFFFNKKRRNTVNIALAASIAGLFVIFTIAMGVTDYFSNAYNSTMSYVSFSLTLIVSSALTVVSHILAQKYNDEILKITDDPKNKEESKTDNSENK